MTTWRQKVLGAAVVLVAASFAVHLADQWLMPVVPVLLATVGLLAVYSLIFRRR